MTDTGVLKREEKPFHCVLLVTSKRLILVPTESSRIGWKEIFEANFPALLWYDIMKQTSVESETEKEKRKNAEESLDRLLKENEHFDIDCSYIEKVELQGGAVKIRISWNPKYVDKELIFSLVKPKIEEFASMLRSALQTGFSEMSKKTFTGIKHVWERKA
jgi:hypothetical protein